MLLLWVYFSECAFISKASLYLALSASFLFDFKGSYPIFWKLLFVNRFEQNLHSICKIKSKTYFAPDIFPIFFLVFFLFTILWTYCNKIVFTQIPQALSVLVLGKNKKCFGKPDKFRKFSLAVFLNFDFIFSQVLPEVTINKNSNFIQFKPPNPPPPPPIVEKLNQI